MKKGAGALGLAILGAVFVPSWPVQLICYVTITLTLLCAAYAGLTRRALRVERDTLDLKAQPHTTVRVGLTVRNSSFLPLSYVAIQDHQGGLRAIEPAQTLVSVPPRGSVRFAYRLKTMGRGVHELGPVSVASADPLGLFAWRVTAGDRCRVTVLPEVGVIQRAPRGGSPAGEVPTRVPLFEDPSRFRSVREYVSGDPPARIHWKTTARLGVLHTVEYEPAVSRPCLVLLDLDLEGYPLRSRYHFVERAIETAATLVLAAQRAGQTTGLVSNGHLESGAPIVALGKGTDHALHILTVLARIAPVEETERRGWRVCEELARCPQGTRVCLVGPQPEAEMVELLRAAVSPWLEVYRISTTAATEAAGGLVRHFTIKAYGEVLAGD